jgi:HK97 family phage portal protein
MEPPVDEYVTSTGLIVTDRRHHRANEVPQVDPRTHDPNANPVVGQPTVGPQSRGGPIMGAPPGSGGFHGEAWAGWPDGWETPYMTTPGAGGDVGLVGRVSTAMTCVDLNSRQLASFATYGYKQAEPFTLPEWATNPEPELYADWSEFMRGVVNSMMIRGEAFIYATGRYANGYPARFAVLNPDVVQIEFIDGRKEYLVDREPVDRADICQVKYQSWPGRLHGVAPLEWAARSMLTAAALERYAAGLATRGGIPWAVLKAKTTIDARQADDVRDRWVEAALRRDGAPAVLSNAFDLEPLSFNPEQMALLDLREFDERRICAAFGVPAYLVNVMMTGSLTYASVNMLFDHHWRATLRPMAGAIGGAWSGWLLPHGARMEFNADRYVQPGFGERAASYQTMFNIVDPMTGERGMYVDEIRAAERLATTKPTIPGHEAAPGMVTPKAPTLEATNAALGIEGGNATA